MEPTYIAALVLCCLPIIGCIISVTMLSSARQNWKADNPASDTQDESQEKAKLLVMDVNGIFAAVIGILEAVMLFAGTAYHSVGLPVYIGVGALGFAGAVLVGVIGSAEIKNGALTPERFGKAVNKLTLPGLLPIAGLLLFYLTAMTGIL